MAVPSGKRFAVQFDEVFPEGASVVGEVTAVTEYQSQEDKARNRPVRPRMTVQPRAETSGQAKWITWVIRATGMHGVNERSGKHTEATPGPAGSVAARSAAA